MCSSESRKQGIIHQRQAPAGKRTVGMVPVRAFTLGAFTAEQEW